MKSGFRGFGIQGYRSFGGAAQFIYPLGKINLVSGQNNSGKSNILRFLVGLKQATDLKDRHSPSNTAPHALAPSFENSHQGKGNHPIRFLLPMPADDSSVEDLITTLLPESVRSRFGPLLFKLIKSEEMGYKDGVCWFEYDPNQACKLLSPIGSTFHNDGRNPRVLAMHEWQALWQSLTARQGGGISYWTEETLKSINPLNRLNLPNVHWVDAFRKIGDPTSDISGYSGQGLIRKLASLEKPNISALSDKAKFQSINDFLKVVTDEPTARIEIPSDHQDIHIEIKGKTLPIASLGTGIHEVLILAACATAITDEIVCIEEPEIHLHPRLQRKLLDYLHERTSNQYFITTHSASLLDAPFAEIFHVSLKDGESKIHRCAEPKLRAGLASELGYRNSDLVQSNFLIWVEGPSDRIFLNYWIREAAPELIEGIDFSIMFYGGRLLSHLCPDDSTVSDFISLSKINRNLAVLMDSDKSSAHGRINSTKQRVSKDVEAVGGIAWVTNGREIENYIPLETAELAAKALLGATTELVDTGPFGKRYMARVGKDQKQIDKVSFAKAIVSFRPGLEELDLKERIGSLVDAIRRSNTR